MTPAKRVTSPHEIAREVGNLTFQLLVACQEKERRAASRFHLSVPEFRVLRGFRGADQISIRALLRILGEDNSRLSRVLRSLERKGFLTRANRPEDRRNVITSLTAKGRALAGALEDQYVQMHTEILHDIPVEIHQPLLIGLENLLRAVETWLKEP
jgi:DNA-binding MarR family transcriptional regulator